MKKNITFMFFVLAIMSGCSSSPVKKDFGVDYGWVCASEEQAKEFKDKKIEVSGNKNCFWFRSDWEQTETYWLRDYDRAQLPSMPDLP